MAQDFRTQLIAEIPHLRRFARSLCGDASLADDLVQDCIERALKKSHLYDVAKPLRAWLYAVLRNIHVSNWRSNAKHLSSKHIDDLQGGEGLHAVGRVVGRAQRPGRARTLQHAGVHPASVHEIRHDLAAVEAAVIADRLAETGEILVSRTVRDLVIGSELTFTERGELDLPSQLRCVDFMIDAGSTGLCILANFSEQFVMTDEDCTTVRAVLWTTSKYINVPTGKKNNHQPEVTNYLKTICVEGIDFEHITLNMRIKTIKKELLEGTFIAAN